MTSIESGSNVGVAFGLVIGAALSTGLGAAAVFFPRIVKLTSTRVLASSLAFAAGVMIYVSLLEIIVKSQGSFADAGYSEGHSHLYATICFFGGVIVMMIVDSIVHRLGGGDHHAQQREKKMESQAESNDGSAVNVVPHCIGCSDDPISELEEWHAKAERESQEMARPFSENGTSDETLNTTDYAAANVGSNDGGIPVNDVIVSGKDSKNVKDTALNTAEEGNVETNKNAKSDNSQSDISSTSDKEKLKDAMEKKKLIQMGASTALGIAIHNFPEGLATFVAALDDPKVGAVLAIALGIHNIPEGLCVALPVYYATGNRMKGFLWGLLSGLTEPIGALIGWLVLAKVMKDEVYAILFGLVAGMMTYISFRELIPTAFRYDPNDTLVTYSVILGMLVMAISLILFQF